MIPYRKSYKKNSIKEVLGWKNATQDKTTVKCPLEISKPFKVKSLSEFHKILKYPVYHPESSWLPSPVARSSFVYKSSKLFSTPSCGSPREAGVVYQSDIIQMRHHPNIYSLSTKSNESGSIYHSYRGSINSKTKEKNRKIFEEGEVGELVFLDEEICRSENHRLEKEGEQLKNELIAEKNGEFVRSNSGFALPAVKKAVNKHKKNFKSEPVSLTGKKSKSQRNLNRVQDIKETYINPENTSENELVNSSKLPEKKIIFQSEKNSVLASRSGLVESTAEEKITPGDSLPQLHKKNSYNYFVSNPESRRNSSLSSHKLDLPNCSGETIDSPQSFTSEFSIQKSPEYSQSSLCPIQEVNFNKETDRKLSNSPPKQPEIQKKDAEPINKNLYSSKKSLELVVKRESEKKTSIKSNKASSQKEKVQIANSNNSLQSFPSQSSSQSKDQTRISLKNQLNFDEIQAFKLAPPELTPSNDLLKSSLNESIKSRTDRSLEPVEYSMNLSEQSSYEVEEKSKTPKRESEKNRRKSSQIYSKNSENSKKIRSIKKAESLENHLQAGLNLKKTSVDLSNKRKGLKIVVHSPIEETPIQENPKRAISLTKVSKKRRKSKRNATDGDKLTVQLKPPQKPFNFSSSVDRFINNYSMSLISILTLLYVNLKKNVRKITQEINSPDKVNYLAKRRSSSLKKLTKKSQVIRRRMKIELSVVLKPTEKSKKIENDLVIENIRKSIFSDGMKNELISFIKRKQTKKHSKGLHHGMTKIIKERLNSSATASSGISMESSINELSLSSGHEESYSKSENEVFEEFAESNTLHPDLKKYNKKKILEEINKSYLSQSPPKKEQFLDFTNRKLKITEHEIEHVEYDGNFYIYNENNVDLCEDLTKIKSPFDSKKFIFSSQVRPEYIRLPAHPSLEELEDISYDDGLDLQNFRNRLLKKRFFNLKSLAFPEPDIVEQDCRLVIQNPDFKEEFEVYDQARVLRYLKRLKYSKNKPSYSLPKPTSKTFSNLIKLTNK